MKNTLLKTALVLSVVLYAVNLYGGEIGKSPKVYFYPSISKFQSKYLNVNANLLPEDPKKRLLFAKKKKGLKAKKRKQKEIEQGNLGEIILGTSAAILLTGGIITFIIGAVLFNPVIWIICLIVMALGVILAFVFFFNELFLGGIIFLGSGVITSSVILFIIGLVFGLLSLWVVGIVLFALLLGVFFLVLFKRVQ